MFEFTVATQGVLLVFNMLSFAHLRRRSNSPICSPWLYHRLPGKISWTASFLLGYIAINSMALGLFLTNSCGYWLRTMFWCFFVTCSSFCARILLLVARDLSSALEAQHLVLARSDTAVLIMEKMYFWLLLPGQLWFGLSPLLRVLVVVEEDAMMDNGYCDWVAFTTFGSTWFAFWLVPVWALIMLTTLRLLYAPLKEVSAPQVRKALYKNLVGTVVIVNIGVACTWLFDAFPRHGVIIIPGSDDWYMRLWVWAAAFFVFMFGMVVLVFTTLGFLVSWADFVEILSGGLFASSENKPSVGQSSNHLDHTVLTVEQRPSVDMIVNNIGSRGVSYEVLHSILLLSEENATGAQVCKDIVIPMTKAKNVPFVHLLLNRDNIDGSPCVSHANCFVSHAWNYRLKDLLDMLRDIDREHTSRGIKAYFWYDIVALNQHRLADSTELPKLVDALQACDSVALCCKPWNRPVVLTRVWCLFEIFHALNLGIPISVAMTPDDQRNSLKAVQANPRSSNANDSTSVTEIVVYDTEQRTPTDQLANGAKGEADSQLTGAAYADIDVRQAKATVPEDKAKIFKEVENTPGGIDSFNTKIREFMMGWANHKLNRIYDMSKL